MPNTSMWTSLIPLLAALLTITGTLYGKRWLDQRQAKKALKSEIQIMNEAISALDTQIDLTLNRLRSMSSGAFCQLPQYEKWENPFPIYDKDPSVVGLFNQKQADLIVGLYHMMRCQIYGYNLYGSGGTRTVSEIKLLCSRMKNGILATTDQYEKVLDAIK